MPAVPRSQLLLYAGLALVIAVLGARALRASGAASTPPAAVVEAPGAPGASGAGGGAAPAAPGSPGASRTDGEAAPGAARDGAGTAAADGNSAASGTGARAPAAGSEGAAGPGAAEVLVHVAGAVRRPGVYRLTAGARVQDAVTSAGGARGGADLHRLNLAAKVADGQQIRVPRRGERTPAAVQGSGAPAGAAPAGAVGTSGPGATGAGPAERIDLNSATIDQLETLDGVGPAIAQKIVDWREANGGFRSVDDLAQVSGIGPKKLEAMRPRVGV